MPQPSLEAPIALLRSRRGSTSGDWPVGCRARRARSGLTRTLQRWWPANRRGDWGEVDARDAANNVRAPTQQGRAFYPGGGASVLHRRKTCRCGDHHNSAPDSLHTTVVDPRRMAGVALAEFCRPILLDALSRRSTVWQWPGERTTYRVQAGRKRNPPCFVLQRAHTRCFPAEAVRWATGPVQAHVERRLRQGFPGLRGRRLGRCRGLPARRNAVLVSGRYYLAHGSILANSESFEPSYGLAQAAKWAWPGLVPSPDQRLPVGGALRHPGGLYIHPPYLSSTTAVLGTGPDSVTIPDVASCRAFVGARVGCGVLEASSRRGETCPCGRNPWRSRNQQPCSWTWQW